jgi:uncharacterized membrane protein YedE/YeeE
MAGDQAPVERNGQNGQQPHVGATAKAVAEHASALTRLELELALLELKRKALALGVGTATAAAAGLLVVIGIVFAFVTVTAALALAVSTWLACLIVMVVLFAIAGVLGLLAKRSFAKAAPPVPEQAIEQAKLTTAALKK